jgi:hypothetical protein
MRLALLCVLLAGCATKRAPDPLPPAPRTVPVQAGPAADVAVVARARAFSVGAIGFLGAPSAEQTAVEAIARADGAIAELEWLAANATIAGQLYAVWELQQLSPDRAAPHLERLRSDPSDVTTVIGCLMSPDRVAEIAARIADGSPRPTERSRRSTPAPSPR